MTIPKRTDAHLGGVTPEDRISVDAFSDASVDKIEVWTRSAVFWHLARTRQTSVAELYEKVSVSNSVFNSALSELVIQDVVRRNNAAARSDAQTLSLTPRGRMLVDEGLEFARDLFAPPGASQAQTRSRGRLDEVLESMGYYSAPLE